MKKKSVVMLGLFSLYLPVLAETELDTLTVEGQRLDSPMLEETQQLNSAAANQTLGGYLDSLPNVDSVSYGEAVGRPMVRGMSGYRVKILQNDHEISDLSAMSDDHAVAIAARASERIELLKGPASLLYAAKAGGVIKITDSLSAPFPEPGMQGEISAEMRESAYSVDGRLSLANAHWALRLGGLQQQAEDYAAADGERIADSDVNTSQGQMGLSWLASEKSEWQLTATSLRKDYGIPNDTPEETRIEMIRQDVGAAYRYFPTSDWLEEMSVDVLSSDYLHDETEDGRKDGLFGQQQQRGALNLLWNAGDWLGESRLTAAQSELKVCHEHGACEDFEDATRTGGPLGESILEYLDSTGLPYSHGHPMPDTNTRLWEISTVAERELVSERTLSFAVNSEWRSLSADPDNIQEQWVYPPSEDSDYYADKIDHALSLSAGLAKAVTADKFGWEASLSYIERLPSVDQLYWNGFHHATESYIFGDENLDKERSVNLDVDVIYQQGQHQLQLSGFYYAFSDYIYQEQGYDEDGNALVDPFHLSDVWFTQQTDARFLGGSARYEFNDAKWLRDPLSLWGQLDLLEAKTTDGDYLPRSAPVTAEFGVRYQPETWMSRLSVKQVFAADNLAANEEKTPGYAWVSWYVQKQRVFGQPDLRLWLKAENLFDAEAQNHLSVLKDSAPLPGRQVTLGVNWKF